MKLFRQIPLVTAGLLMVAMPAAAKALSPKALVKNCDQVTQELTGLKTHLEGIVTDLENDTWDSGIFKKLEENSEMAEKFRASAKQLTKNEQDSREPNLRAARRAAAQGKESVLQDMVSHQNDFADCISTNKRLLADFDALTERHKDAVSSAVSKRQPATAEPSVKKHFSMPAIQPPPTLSARSREPEASQEVFRIEL